MSDYSQELIDRTLKLWQKRTSETLTREDARQILDTMLGYVAVLSRLRLERHSMSTTKAHVDTD